MKQQTWIFAIGVSLALASAGAGYAESRIEAIARHLRGQGYSDIEISRTWLGRARIEAQRGTVEREIIVNPRTGEILRDYWDDDDEDTVLGGQDRDREERRPDRPEVIDGTMTDTFDDRRPDHDPGGWHEGGVVGDVGVEDVPDYDDTSDPGGWGGDNGGWNDGGGWSDEGTGGGWDDSDTGGGWNDGPDDHGGGHGGDHSENHGGGHGGDRGGDHGGWDGGGTGGGHGDHSRDY
ncbi:hypothetical protein [Shimia marina]|uniref:PepSY domain-containing protein n=1 Tax=Shimia marina TaxID=321267 RepID=A0A0P1FAC6_9RHOB|nr:hypothetical protein [Shimia marina]CUH52953.1 hypothetical protein SHM7688_02400 [Shimia marina]SFD91003.1 hypothetical protein SAMN04488037_103201 [Shimia marina]